jgi:hypothetical protein
MDVTPDVCCRVWTLSPIFLPRARYPHAGFPFARASRHPESTMTSVRLLRRLPLLLLVLALGAVLGSRVTAQRRQLHNEPQPHMRQALDALRSAEHHLTEATGDKGGHRVRAINLVRQAEAEVQRGIAWDNSHR